jgi:hypothetical protein
VRARPNALEILTELLASASSALARPGRVERLSAGLPAGRVEGCEAGLARASAESASSTDGRS